MGSKIRTSAKKKKKYICVYFEGGILTAVFKKGHSQTLGVIQLPAVPAAGHLLLTPDLVTDMGAPQHFSGVFVLHRCSLLNQSSGMPVLFASRIIISFRVCDTE